MKRREKEKYEEKRESGMEFVIQRGEKVTSHHHFHWKEFQERGNG